MKTLQEFYQEITQCEELKKQFAEAAGNNTVVEFAKANGVETTLEEIKTFLDERAGAEGEISDIEAENAAGGACNSETASEAVVSVFTAGVACAIRAVGSAVDGHVGQQTDEEGRICNVPEEDRMDKPLIF